MHHLYNHDAWVLARLKEQERKWSAEAIEADARMVKADRMWAMAQRAYYRTK